MKHFPNSGTVFLERQDLDYLESDGTIYLPLGTTKLHYSDELLREFAEQEPTDDEENA